MAMSRGRHTNTLYLANPKHDRQCTHLTHPEPRDALDALTTSLDRSSAQTAAIDHFAGSAPPSSDVAERVAWIVARRRGEHDQPERQQTGVKLAVGR